MHVKCHMRKTIQAVFFLAVPVLSFTLFLSVKEKNELLTEKQRLIIQNDSLHVELLETKIKLRKITDSIKKHN